LQRTATNGWIFLGEKQLQDLKGGVVQAEQDKKDFFISYTSRTEQNKQWAVWLEWALRELGYTTIMQEYDFSVGDNFRVRMDDAVIQSHRVIGVMTTEYLKSDNCKEEWTSADWFIPVRFDNCEIEGLLKRRIYINLSGCSSSTEAFTKLKDGLTVKIRPISEPPFYTTTGSGLAEPPFPLIPPNNLPERDSYFTGRDDQMEAVDSALRNTGKVSLVGAGGFGKTALAVEYASRHLIEYDFVWLFNAESEITINNSYREFAYRFELIDRNIETDQETITEAVRNYLESKLNWLVIYDNAEGLGGGINNYLPRGHVSGKVIICTREEQPDTGTVVNVAVFPLEDAVSFIKSRTIETNETDARELAELLGCLPLALEHATAYMTATRRGCRAHFDSLNSNGLAILDRRASTHNYDKTVTTTWLVSIGAIEFEAVKQLLNLLAYCAPDDIPLSMFVKGSDVLPEPLKGILASGNDLAVDDLLGELSRYSLVSYRRDDSEVLISLHRLIQAVLISETADDTSWLKYCLACAAAVFAYEYGDSDSMLAFARQVDHVLQITRHVQHILPDNESKLLVTRIFNTAGYGFDHNASYTQALELYQKALAIREQILGVNHPTTATSYNNLAGVYDSLGNYNQALELYQKALAINEQTLGEDHPDTASSYNNLAYVYRTLGNYDQALELYNKALAINEQILGVNHLDTATSYNNLAAVYHSLGDYEQALKYLHEALAINEETLGVNHPDTATSYNNLASVYSSFDNYDQALDYCQKALAIREQILGVNHPTTATSYNNLASVYRVQGNYDQALELYQKALAICEQVLGDQHPDTARVQNNIEILLNEMGSVSN
jgi:tetratricopeptide (TPR) repeat protein